MTNMNTATATPRMLTIRQCAATGILPEVTIRRLVKEKRIAFVMVGNRALVNFDRLVDTLNKGDM